MKLQAIPDIDSIDRIKVKTREDLLKVVNWSFENLNIMRKFRTSEYPLQRGLIQVEDKADVLFRVNGRYVTVTLFYFEEDYLTFEWDSEDTDDNNILIKDIRSPEQWGQKKVDKYIEETIIMVNAFMAYMVYFRQDVESTSFRKPIVKKGKKGKGNKVTRYVKIGVHYFNPNPPKPSGGEKREYERKTESWPVRGFWRTYKSGKRAWIQPGVRGPKKDGKRNPKLYTV